ncbi:hypothetical protein BC749_10486 [Flavobacterium araucananum]|uniref:hypothetical protein n=1 Tax=Flavobacterium araucananum TaxID=946678 RepID=UPI000D793583|nr:hypothetical protein [Flavobacterium araucananum]PWJ98940.1 hypothetical protein BC749_10486 [Flavobacterium araucananum]
MNYIELNLEELNDFEIETTEGGGFFYELGAGAHMIWNSVNKFLDEHPDMTSHSRQGI